jgi:hypothetical protein
MGTYMEAIQLILYTLKVRPFQRIRMPTLNQQRPHPRINIVRQLRSVSIENPRIVRPWMIFKRDTSRKNFVAGHGIAVNVRHLGETIGCDVGIL